MKYNKFSKFQLRKQTDKPVGVTSNLYKCNAVRYVMCHAA